MATTVTTLSLMAPIAAATVVSVATVVALWRGSVAERKTGTVPWWTAIVAVVYAVIVAGWMYFQGKAALVTPLDYFLASLVGQMFGGGVVLAWLAALFYSRGQPVKDRVMGFLAAIIATGIVAGGMLGFK